MRTLLILGAGQYGYAAKEVAEAMEIYGRIEFLDDRKPIAIGKLDRLSEMTYDEAFVAIGNPSVRAHWLRQVKQAAILIHPKAVVSPSAVIGEGSIVEAGAVISTDAQIGTGTIVMANAVVGHNATVGAYCQLKYNSTIPENCVVPEQTKVDCNVVYRDNAEIEAKKDNFRK